MVRPAPARRIGEWTGLDPSACCGVSLFRHEIVGYEGHGLVRERVFTSSIIINESQCGFGSRLPGISLTIRHVSLRALIRHGPHTLEFFLSRHEIVGYKDHGLVRERVLHLR